MNCVRRQDIDSEVDFFDVAASKGYGFDPFSAKGWEILAGEFQSMCSPGERDKLLDVGCGTGSSSKIYTPVISSYLGVDLSPVSVNTARLYYPKLNFELGNACSLPLPDESFNIVAFSSVLHHIPNYLAALKEAYRILKPNGRIFAYDPNIFNPAMALFRVPSSPFFLKKGVTPNESPLRRGDLREQITLAGFRDVRQYCRSGIEYKHVEPEVINSLLKFYNIIDEGIERIGLGRWFGTFLISSAKK